MNAINAMERGIMVQSGSENIAMKYLNINNIKNKFAKIKENKGLLYINKTVEINEINNKNNKNIFKLFLSMEIYPERFPSI